MLRPEITIAIPTVDRIGFVGESLRSAVSQTYPSFEVLLSDNSADPRYTEQLDAVVERARADFPHAQIRVLTQPEQVPMTEHANILIQEALGRFWTYLSDDDRLLHEWAERTTERLAVDEEASLGFSDHWIIDGEGTRDPGTSDRHTSATGRGRLAEGLVEGDELDEAALRWSIPLLGTLFRITTLREFGFTPGNDALDVDLVLRIADRGDVAATYQPERLTEYRRHDGNYSPRWTPIQRRSLVEALESCPSLARRHPKAYKRSLSDAYATLGKSYLGEGSRKPAWTAIRRALALDRTNPLAYRFLLQLPLPHRGPRSSHPHAKLRSKA